MTAVDKPCPFIGGLVPKVNYYHLWWQITDVPNSGVVISGRLHIWFMSVISLVRTAGYVNMNVFSLCFIYSRLYNLFSPVHWFSLAHLTTTITLCDIIVRFIVKDTLFPLIIYKSFDICNVMLPDVTFFFTLFYLYFVDPLVKQTLLCLRGHICMRVVSSMLTWHSTTLKHIGSTQNHNRLEIESPYFSVSWIFPS